MRVILVHFGILFLDGGKRPLGKRLFLKNPRLQTLYKGSEGRSLICSLT